MSSHFTPVDTDELPFPPVDTDEHPFPPVDIDELPFLLQIDLKPG
jgi:hypothetical protein